MKQLVILLSTTLILSSCYSYKRINPNEDGFVTGERYKLFLEGRGKCKGKIKEVLDSAVILKSAGGKEEFIRIAELKRVKKGKFSLAKSILMPTAITGTSVLLLYLGLKDMSLGIGEFDWGY